MGRSGEGDQRIGRTTFQGTPDEEARVSDLKLDKGERVAPAGLHVHRRHVDLQVVMGARGVEWRRRVGPSQRERRRGAPGAGAMEVDAARRMGEANTRGTATLAPRRGEGALAVLRAPID